MEAMEANKMYVLRVKVMHPIRIKATLTHVTYTTRVICVIVAL